MFGLLCASVTLVNDLLWKWQGYLIRREARAILERLADYFERQQRQETQNGG